MVIQVVAALVLALFVVELGMVSVAEACSSGYVSAYAVSCYPWNTEGSSGDFWHYANKGIYLKVAALQTGVVALAVIVPFLAPGPRSGSLVSLVTLVAGLTGPAFLTNPS